MKFSYWESSHYSSSIIIIGAGIVGMSTAISLKEKDSKLKVTIIDRQWPPKGASTKNAGFLCYGSPSEILADIKSFGKEECIRIVKSRYEGGQKLIERIGHSRINYCGGYELYESNHFPTPAEIDLCNSVFQEAVGKSNYFQEKENQGFDSFHSKSIYMPDEGKLNPVLMMNALRSKAEELGVQMIFGQSVTKIDTENKTLLLERGLDLQYYKCIVCTNGFTQHLLPNLEVMPARNIVMVTSEIPGLDWDSVFHFKEGYYYFRRIGNRILIGGARSLDAQNEITDQFGINPKIKNHLVSFLNERILQLQNKKVQIEQEWSGILGIGKSKHPIVKWLSDDLLIGVRLGGMGVAIGSALGEILASKMYHCINEN